jgi:hypothetical protein
MRIYVKNKFTTLALLEFMNILQYKLMVRLCSETLLMLKVTTLHCEITTLVFVALFLFLLGASSSLLYNPLLINISIIT